MPDVPDAVPERDEALEELLEGAPAANLGRLPVLTQIQELPFTQISWQAFEQLCWRVIKREPRILPPVSTYGKQGSTQKGIDIFARRVAADGTVERWVYQCKNHQEFPLAKLRHAIGKFEMAAEQYVVIFASRATIDHRNIEREWENVQVWDGENLGEKLKQHPDLVADFFGLGWVRPFCDPVATDAWLANGGRAVVSFAGTVYDHSGHPFVNASIRVLAGDDGWVGMSGAEGQFRAELVQPSPQITVLATYHSPDRTLSGLRTFSWDEVGGGAVTLSIQDEPKLTANIFWFGRRQRVEEANVEMLLSNSVIRNLRGIPGLLNTSMPPGSVCELHVDVPGAAVRPVKVQVRPSSEVLDIYVARGCAPDNSEVVEVQWICDDCEIDFVRVVAVNPTLDSEQVDRVELHVEEVAGLLRLEDGGADFPAEPEPERGGAVVAAFQIGRFPVTCAQYAFYLQHMPGVTLPTGWSHCVPPSGKEDHPISGVTWAEARQYCEWLTEKTGIRHRLPTRTEWITAAGGTDGRVFPWGNSDEDLANRCNTVEDNIHQTTSVRRYPNGRSPYGVWDMAGNIWEWVGDDPPNQGSGQPPADGEAPAAAPELRFACGGSYQDPRSDVHCQSHLSLVADRRYPQVGFRVLRNRREEI